MAIIIDAQIVLQYYKESVLENMKTEYTGTARDVINSITQKNRVYVDDQDQIYNEWERIINQEWFGIWYQRLLAEDKIIIVPVDNHNELRRLLYTHGFPRDGGDFWYIRTAMAVPKALKPILITEDMDFHEPKKKGTSSVERRKILTQKSGSIARLLKKKRGIMVLCIANYIQYIHDLPPEED